MPDLKQRSRHRGLAVSFFLFAAFLFYADYAQAKTLAHGERPVRYVSLDGEWEFRRITGVFVLEDALAPKDADWSVIKTPANWHSAGVDHSGSAIYQKKFALSKLDKKKRAFLEFKGVDYAADVWLNGVFVGSHQGYFQAFDFDITDKLQDGANTLTVAVHSPNEPVGDVWSLRKQLIKGIFNHHDTRPGGAWSSDGQDMNTGGIWAPVRLKISGPVVFNDLAVTPTFDEQQNGRVNIAATMNASNAARARYVEIRIKPFNFDGESVMVRRDIRGDDGRSLNIDIDQGAVALWQPRELGRPNLYALDVTLYDRNGASDHARRVFGYRTVRRDEKTGEWFVNGKRYFLRGTNYIPTQWLSEMSVQDYEADLALMQLANINIIRIHAHIGARALYDVADRKGMLIWQDFPLQWGYDDSDAFRAEAQRQALDMVRQFRDHPSIIAWSMQNEPPWDASWMQYKYPKYDPTQNKALTAALYETVKDADPSRYVHSHSATAEHPWLGWYSGSWRDYAKPTDQSLITEFGAQALPGLENLRRIFPQDALWPDTEEDWELWRYHNFQKHELTNIAGVSIGENVREFIGNTQEYQARLTKFAAESLRRQKYAPVGGVFQFMFNEDWPSVNWGIVDYWRAPKPGFKSLQVAYQPVLASVEWPQEVYAEDETIELDVWINNDLHERFENAVYELRLVNAGGASTASRLAVDIEPDSVKKIAEWAPNTLPKGAYELVVKVTTQDGDILSLNSYEFAVR